MRIDYAPRAIRDLETIAEYYRTVAAPKIAGAFAERVEYAINRLAHLPQSAPRVIGRTGVRSVLVLRYPCKIFYRLRGDVVEVLHIRHTSRRPWSGNAD